MQAINTTEAKIATNGLRDLYAVLGEERDGGGGAAAAREVLAPWIWLGALFMASGGGVAGRPAAAGGGAGAPGRGGAGGTEPGLRMNRRVLLLAPFGVAVAAGAGFWRMLRRA